MYRYQKPTPKPPIIPATAPALFALFHQTPKTRGKKRPELAKQNAHATAPKIEVSLSEATNAPAAPIDRSLSQLNLEREIFVRIDLLTLAPSILQSANLILTLPSKTAQRMAKNYSFIIAELPIELEKRKTKLIWHNELSSHPSFDWI